MNRMLLRFVVLVVAGLSVGVFAQETAQEKFNHSTFDPYVKYPTIALAAHVQGTVVAYAVLDENGYAKAVEVESGHPMLRGAVVDALRNARFDSSGGGRFRINFHFAIVGRDTDADWKQPEKTEWLLPEVTVVRRALPLMVNTTSKK